METGYAVRAEALKKSFGTVMALSGLDLEVRSGICFGVLGPNGAGKTTAIRIFATITEPDSGRAVVAGFDVVDRPDEVRRRIGLAGQYAAVEEDLTGRENLRIFGRLFGLSRSSARRRADELLAQYRLDAAADRLVKGYSGGMRRRLDLLASLIISPDVLFLDEPTTGLDPRSRLQLWDAVRELRNHGTTVLLTTQNLDEADYLADEVVIVDHGKVVAGGTPTQLKGQLGERLDVVLLEGQDLTTAAAEIARATRSPEAPSVDADMLLVSVAVPAGTTVPDVVRALDASGVAVTDVTVRRPTLDEVFLRTTDPSGQHRPADSEAVLS